MLKWGVQKGVNQCVAKTGFDITLSEAELEVCQHAIRRVICLSKLLLIEDWLSLCQLKYIAMLEINGVDWNEIQGVVCVCGDLVGLLWCEVTMYKPYAGTSSHPCFKLSQEILESIVLQGCQKIRISWCILDHDLWENIQYLSIRLGLKGTCPVSLMEFLCFLEKFLHFLLVHVLQFLKILEWFGNILWKSVIIALPIESNIFGIYLNEENHTDLSC